MVAKAFTELWDVDGQCGRRVMPFPHTPYQDAKVRMWEISVAERLDHIRSKLNHDEMTLLQAFIAAISGNDMETVGFFDVLRWWALSGYNADGLYELTETFKVRSQSEFAQCFFNEACSTRSFSYSFSTLVKAVKHHGDTVVAHDHSGGIWRARRLICTLPLNVLHETEFEPPLPPNKLSISKKGHINEGAKVHMEVQGRELRSWSVAAWPSSRVFSGRGDGLTPAGNTHVVFFGANKRFRHAQEDAQDFEAAAKKLHAMDVKKVVSLGLNMGSIVTVIDSFFPRFGITG